MHQFSAHLQSGQLGTSRFIPIDGRSALLSNGPDASSVATGRFRPIVRSRRRSAIHLSRALHTNWIRVRRLHTVRSPPPVYQPVRDILG